MERIVFYDFGIRIVERSAALFVQFGDGGQLIPGGEFAISSAESAVLQSGLQQARACIIAMQNEGRPLRPLPSG